MASSPGAGTKVVVATEGPNPPRSLSGVASPGKDNQSSSGYDVPARGNDPRLHKPGVAGSSPAAATTFVLGESNSEYHSDKAWFSKSQLWDLVDRGPEVFFARHIAATDKHSLDTPSIARGRHVHLWSELGPDAFWNLVVEIPESALGAGGRRTKATEEFEKTLAPNAIPLKKDEIASYKQQFARMMANEAFRELTEATTHREASIRWRDVSGLPLKCRPDALTPKVCWDIKTTSEVKPLTTFWKSVVDYGYGFQAVHYLAGCRAAGLEVEEFVFLVTSTVFPYRCHAVRLPQRLLARAEVQLRRTIAEVQMRIEFDHWEPADSGRVTELFVPERYMEEERNAFRPALPWVQ